MTEYDKTKDSASNPTTGPCSFPRSASSDTMSLEGYSAAIELPQKNHPESVRKTHYYWQLAGARDVSEFMDRILVAVNKLGFTDFSFGRLSAKGGAAGNVATTLDDDVLRVYREKQLYLHDMVLQHGEASTKPILTSTVENYISNAPFKTEQIKRTIELIKLNRRFGYNDFYNIPLKAHSGEGNVMLSVSSQATNQVEFRRKAAAAKINLQSLAQTVDYIGTTKFPEFFVAKPTSRNIIITPKPLRLLNTLAKKNLTLKEAAKKLRISLETANKYIMTVKHALGANTQAAAVYLAIKEGLISCDAD